MTAEYMRENPHKITHILLIADDGEQIPCRFVAFTKADYIRKVRQCISHARADEGIQIVKVKCVSKYIFSIEEPIQLFAGNTYICTLE